MYDDLITQKVIGLMRLAPFFYFISAYWMLSNQQLLSNEHLHPLLSANESPRSDHDVSIIFTSQGWKGPYWAFAIMAILSLIYFAF